MSVCQLSELIDTITDSPLQIVMPFLPYGRQDKDVSNDATFGQHTLLFILRQFFDSVCTFDPHSVELLQQYFGKEEDGGIKIIHPVIDIQRAIDGCGADMLCFPDKGAAARYGKDFNLPCVILDKVREQSTGKILGMSIDNAGIVPSSTNILIVDDICDGGRTFREASILLYKCGAKNVHLYISHGIFSQGTEVLHNDGIVDIYTQYGLKSRKK
jgi:ribose-phosphate pyrophosphokinase